MTEWIITAYTIYVPNIILLSPFLHFTTSIFSDLSGPGRATSVPSPSHFFFTSHSHSVIASPCSHPGFQLIPLPSKRDVELQQSYQWLWDRHRRREQTGMRWREEERGDDTDTDSWARQRDREAVRQGQLHATHIQTQTGGQWTLHRCWAAPPRQSLTLPLHI